MYVCMYVCMYVYIYIFAHTHTQKIMQVDMQLLYFSRWNHVILYQPPSVGPMIIATQAPGEADPRDGHWWCHGASLGRGLVDVREKRGILIQSCRSFSQGPLLYLLYWNTNNWNNCPETSKSCLSQRQYLEYFWILSSYTYVRLRTAVQNICSILRFATVYLEISTPRQFWNISSIPIGVQYLQS